MSALALIHIAAALLYSCIVLLVMMLFYLVAVVIEGVTGYTFADNPRYVGTSFCVGLVAGAGCLYWVSKLV